MAIKKPPPGKPDRLRVEHFPRLTVPCLFISGTKDAFGTPADARPLVTGPRAPGAPAPTAGPAGGLRRANVAAPGMPPATPTVPGTTAGVAVAPGSGGSQAAAVAAPAARAGVAAALGGTARAVAPAAAAPRWRDRFSFASPLGR